MRRFLIAAALALSAPAEARLLVVTDQTMASNASNIINMQQAIDRQVVAAKLILDRLGVDYTVKAGNPTEHCRLGIVVSGGVAVQYDGVLHIAFNGKQANVIPGYRPDSLTLSGWTGSDGTKGPRVPQLMWPIQRGNGMAGAATNLFMRDTTTDTTGTIGQTGLCSDDVACQTPHYIVDGAGRAFMACSHLSGTNTGPALPPAGGLRVYLSSSVDGTEDKPGIDRAWKNSGGDEWINTKPPPAAWADSNARIITGSLALLHIWSRPMSHINGAKPIVFAHCSGISSCADTTGRLVPCEFEVQTAVMSLAILDSLAGGNILNKVPVKLGLAIQGGFQRSGYFHPGGIAPNDTTALKASIDSLATLTPPLKAILLSDVDSVAANARDLVWWGRLRGLKYSPMTRAGMDTTGNRVGNSSFTLPIDVWGRHRTRKAFIDTCAAGWDTTIYGGVRALLYKADSIFGESRVSHFLAPPQDDWSPKNLSIGKDSVLYAARLAGASGILFNAQIGGGVFGRYIPRATDLRWSPVNPVGYPQNSKESRFRTYDGSSITLLGHSGHKVGGSMMQWDLRSDSTGICPTTQSSENYTYVSLISHECARAWSQLFLTRWRDEDLMPGDRVDPWDGVNTPVDDRTYGVMRGSVFLMSVQDFGSGNQGQYAAMRPGWWIVKSLHNAFNATNAFAGRTVVTFEHPENITP